MTDMLLGALLVTVGVLASALADRIRGIRLERAKTARARAIEVVDVLLPTAPPMPPRPRSTKPLPTAAGSSDVIEAIVSSGYKRPAATIAVNACTPAERGSLESWTIAALRRCANGGAS